MATTLCSITVISSRGKCSFGITSTISGKMIVVKSFTVFITKNQGMVQFIEEEKSPE
jgi:hypothetical protein